MAEIVRDEIIAEAEKCGLSEKVISIVYIDNLYFSCPSRKTAEIILQRGLKVAELHKIRLSEARIEDYTATLLGFEINMVAKTIKPAAAIHQKTQKIRTEFIKKEQENKNTIREAMVMYGVLFRPLYTYRMYLALTIVS